MKRDSYRESFDMRRDAEEKNLADYLMLIGRRWVTVAAVTAVCSAGAAVYYAAQPDYYSAESQILVEKLDRGASNQQMKEMLLPSLAAEEDYLGTQVSVLTSNKVVGRAIEDLSLRDSVRAVVLNRARSLGARRSAQGGAGDAYKVEAKRAKLSRVITLTVKGPDPKVCEALANRIAERYVEENAKENLFVSNQMYKWLTEEGDVPGSGEELARREEMVGSLQSVVGDSELQRLRSDKADMLNALRELSLRYKPKHPKVQELAHSLEEINSDIEARTQLLVNNMKAALQGHMNISNVRVLDPAVPPTAPSGPDRLMGWLVGTLAGLACGAALVILMESLNRKLRSESDAPAGVKAPFLGSVPLVRGLESGKDVRGAAAYSDLLKNDLELKDAVTGIRTHILFSIPFEESRRIMVASATQSEGDSTVAILLALSLSSMGRKIALIDADLRRPHLHRYLGLESRKGLSEYLGGSAELSEILQTAPGDSLTVIAGGEATANSSALLASARFEELVKRLAESHDRVIVNVPPILYIPDAMIVAKTVSCAVLVCASGVTTKEHFIAACRKFSDMNRTLIGYVLNRVDRNRRVPGTVDRDYDRYRNQYLKIQPYPGSLPPAAPPSKGVPGRAAQPKLS